MLRTKPGGKEDRKGAVVLYSLQVEVIFHYPNNKRHCNKVPSKWLGKILVLDISPEFNCPPEPSVRQMVNIIDGPYKGHNGTVVKARGDSAYIVRIHVDGGWTQQVVLSSQLWVIDASGTKADSAAEDAGSAAEDAGSAAEAAGSAAEAAGSAPEAAGSAPEAGISSDSSSEEEIDNEVARP